jgi:Domain of unknown function (DUF4431)
MGKPVDLSKAAAYTKVAVLLFLVSSTRSFGQQTTELHCLSYEPAVVKLTGTLVRKTFPGPPDYKTVHSGDRPEAYWLLNLSRPVCVDQDKEQPDLNPAQNNVQTIQLVVPAGFYKKYKYLVGRRIAVRGTLFGEHTGHHHTPVLLSVSAIAKAELRVP